MPQPNDNPEQVVDFLIELFTTQGAREYMGEALSMALHMEQSAACARADGAADSLLAAALLHDVGHFLGAHPIDALENGDDNYHEDIGANYLARCFPPSVSEPVRLHVAAKRYLCAVDAGYYARLSPASKNSLDVQGGPMNALEIEAFESSPWYRDAVRLRRYDDNGKIDGLSVEPASNYRRLLLSLLEDVHGERSEP